MREGQTISPDVSIDHQVRVGRVVIVWAKLEGAMQEAIWDLLRLEMDEGRILTERMDAGTLIRILRSLGNRHLPEPALLEFLTAMDEIEDSQEARNFIVHSTWGTIIPGTLPLASSLRAKSDPGQVTAETFPPERMHSIFEAIAASVKYLVALRPTLRTLPRKSAEGHS